MADEIDNDSLLARLQKLEAQNASLLAAQGIPADPVAAHVKALTDHVNVRANMVPQHDFSEVQRLLADLGENPTPNQTDVIARKVSRLGRSMPEFASELGYVEQLAEELHDLVLAAESDRPVE